MFATTSDPASSSGEHLVFVPRGVLQANTSNLYASVIHGIGLVVGAAPFGCDLRDSTFVEEWWPIAAAPDSPAWSSYNFTKATPPDTCSANALTNRTWYDVTVSVSNTGQASYNVYRGSTFITSGVVTYGSSPFTEAAFNATSTGYFLTNTQGATRDYTAYVTNLSVSWQ